MRLLLISNSTNPGEPFLDYPKNRIKEFLGNQPLRALFIPYAAVTFSYDDYEEKVYERFQEIGHEIISIHHFNDPVEAVKNSSAIVIGGGNTWKLLKTMQDYNLVRTIRDKVVSGIPYIGWSAGSNVACPTIMTTNDMPVVAPASFVSLNLVPFQINPHYTDTSPEGHSGESREQRINEFIETNPYIYVVGLREGTMLIIENNSVHLSGWRKTRIFKKGSSPLEIGPGEDLTFILK